jgi:hypothetical protein
MGFFDFAVRTGDVSLRYSNRPFYDFFSIWSSMEIITFLLVFLIGFVISYTGLKKFFTKIEPRRMNHNTGVISGGGPVVENKNALMVISISISILMALGLSRSGWLFHYFGAIAGIFWLFLVSAVFVIIFMAVFKFVSMKFGDGLGMVTFVLLLWATLRYFVSNHLQEVDLPSTVVYYLQAVTDVWALAIGLVAGLVLAKSGILRSVGRQINRRAGAHGYGGQGYGGGI